MAIIQQEVRELCALGVDMIQLNEPVLHELVATQGAMRDFLCLPLPSQRVSTKELVFAVGLINRVTDLIHELSATRSALHVCRGNLSTREGKRLPGSYRTLAPVFERIRVSQLVLEYATPRAGDLMPFGRKELGLGVVDPRTTEIESAGQIVARVTQALAHYPADKLFLNPDCGFATFSGRPMTAEAVASGKLRSMVAAARELRSRHA